MRKLSVLGPIGILGLAVVAILSAGCAQETAKAASLPPTKWVINMTALEYKGSTEVAKEAFPTQASPGGGYILKQPVDGKWETSTYRWAPETVTVYQGDDVELKVFGVNGSEHVSTIEGYVDNFNVKRGQLTTVSFKADKVGVFKITCKTHQPAMEGHLIVLPRP